MIKRFFKKFIAFVTIVTSILSIPFIDFPNLWQKIKSLTIVVFNYIFFSTSVIPNWLVGIMLLCVVVIVVVFLYVIKDMLFNNWRDYTSDTFFDLKWYWKFCPTQGNVEDLYSCCSKCSYQIHPENNYSNTTYKCDNCGYSVGPLNGSNNDIESKVRRSIQQKLRLDTWKSNNKLD